jgi:alkylation response protein AidB-like acyl-CoA dehydrogenase
MSVRALPRRSALGEIADELRESVNAFVQSRSPEPEVRRLMETESGFDAATWAQMAEQLELPGMTIPERFGGSGFAIDAQAIVFEEMGRALMCTPYLSTFLAVEALLGTGDEAVCAEYLPPIARGERRLAMGLLEGTGLLDHTNIQTAVTESDAAQARLRGEKTFVIDGQSAHALVVLAKEDAGLSTFVVEMGETGVERTPLKTLDLTRRQARVCLDGANAQRVGLPGNGAEVIARVIQRAAVALSAESVGCASACLEMSIAYAKDRVQFGQPIGSFQAVKHKCAEMLRLTEQARAAAYEAAVRTAADGQDASLVASIAKAYCSEAASWVAAENIQVHGGIGYTWEHPAHLYFRRARSNELLFGGPAHHRDHVLKCLEI